MGLFLSKDDQVLQETIHNALDTLDQLERQLEANKANAAFQQKLVQLMLNENLKPKQLINSEASRVTRTEFSSKRNNLEGAVACSEHSEDPFDMILMEMLEHSKDGNTNEAEGMLISFKTLQTQFEKYVPKRPLSKVNTKESSETRASLVMNYKKKEEECRYNDIVVKALKSKEKGYKKMLSQMEDKDIHRTQEVINLQQQIKELEKSESNVKMKHRNEIKDIREELEAKYQTLETEKYVLGKSLESFKNKYWDEKTKMSDEYKSLSETIDILRSESSIAISTHENENRQLNKKIQNFQNEIERLKNELLLQGKENVTICQKYQNLTETHNEIIQHQQRLTDKEQIEKTKLANEYSQKMLLLQNDKMELNKEIKELNKKYRDQIQDQEDKIEELQIKLSRVFDDHNKEKLRYQSDIELLQTENRNEKQIKQDKIKQLTKQNQDSLLKQQETIKALKNENACLVEKHTVEIKKLQSLMQIEKQSLVDEHTAEKQCHQGKIEDLQIEIKSLTERHHAEIQNHKDEIDKLKDGNKTLIEMQGQLHDELEKLQNQKELLTAQNKEVLLKQKNKDDEHSDKLKRMNDNTDELESRVKNYEHKNKELQVKINEHNKRIEKITKEHAIDIEHRQQKFEELEKKNTRIDQTYTNKLMHIEEEKETIHKNYEVLMKKSSSMKEQHNTKEKQLRQDIDKLKREVLQQNEELEIYKRQIRVPAALQIYCPPRGNMTSPLLEGIKHLITEKFGVLRMDLSLKICEDVKDVVDYKPALVLCLNASRLGTDVSRALEGLTATSLKSVVVIHPKEQRALPSEASKDVLSSPHYRSLGGIYDMAFLSERGYYACEMNNTAVDNIAEFIRNICIGFE